MSILIKIFLAISVITCSLAAIAQQNASTIIDQQFDQYHHQAFTEKLYVHTDQNFYLAGEIIWFKLYYVEGHLHRPQQLSKVAYVEILDKDHKSILQGKILLDDGSGNGSFYLPASINSGVYTFRAYTQWIKNFSADFYFEKPLTIVNSLKNHNVPTPQEPAYDIQFFPEGATWLRILKAR